jgi:TRAP-type C4-dicarboxylate transport system substrate-binding protein
MWIGSCRSLIRLVAALAVLICAITTRAHAAERELRLGYFLPSLSSQFASVQRFARDVNQATDGAVEIKLDFSGPDSVLIKRVKAGDLDLVVVQSGLGSVVDQFRLFDLPYLVRDRRHMLRLIFELVFPEMAPTARESGLEIIGVVDGGFRQLYGIRPITRAEELKGLRIRTVGSAPLANFFQYVGAQPVSVPFSEIERAMDKGVIDAVDISLGGVAATQKLAKDGRSLPRYVTITNHVYTPVYIITSTATLRKLNDRIQNALKTVGRETVMFSFRESEASDRRDREQLGNEVKVYDLSESERQSFIEISRRSYDSFAFELGVHSNLIVRALLLGYGS